MTTPSQIPPEDQELFDIADEAYRELEQYREYLEISTRYARLQCSQSGIAGEMGEIVPLWQSVKTGY